MTSCYSNARHHMNDNNENTQTRINNGIMIRARMCQYFKKCCFTIQRQSM